MSATANPVLTATGELHRERVRRFRWLPWPNRESWWAVIDMGSAGVGFVAEGSEEACRSLAVESVRFMHDYEPEGEPGCPAVVIWWKAVHR